MTIVKREFVWNDYDKRKTKYWKSGWLLTSMPNFDPCHQDYVVMHDTFEHQPDDQPDIEHEMMAFGALAFIRVKGLWNVFDGIGDARRSLSADVLHFLAEVKFEISECLDVKELHPELVQEFAAIRAKFKTEFTSEWNDNNVIVHGKDGIERALYWVSKGYSRAQTRWEGHSSSDVCRMLESTLKQLKVVTGRNIEYCESPLHPIHGSKLIITFNTYTLHTNIKYVRNPRIKYQFPVDKAA